MSVLPILQMARSAAVAGLRSGATDVTIWPGWSRDMFDTMYDAPGRGLAAPQVGVMPRVFVMDCDWKDGDKTPDVCINPEIVEASGRR